MSKPKNGITNRLAWAGGSLALIGTLWTGYMKFDTTYARAADVREQINETKGLYLRSEQRALQKEKFSLELKRQQTGKLWPLEQGRLNEITNDLKAIEDQIKSMRGR